MASMAPASLILVYTDSLFDLFGVKFCDQNDEKLHIFKFFFIDGFFDIYGPIMLDSSLYGWYWVI